MYKQILHLFISINKKTLILNKKSHKKIKLIFFISNFFFLVFKNFYKFGVKNILIFFCVFWMLRATGCCFYCYYCHCIDATAVHTRTPYILICWKDFW